MLIWRLRSGWSREVSGTSTNSNTSNAATLWVRRKRFVSFMFRLIVLFGYRFMFLEFCNFLIFVSPRRTLELLFAAFYSYLVLPFRGLWWSKVKWVWEAFYFGIFHVNIDLRRIYFGSLLKCGCHSLRGHERVLLSSCLQKMILQDLLFCQLLRYKYTRKDESKHSDTCRYKLSCVQVSLPHITLSRTSSYVKNNQFNLFFPCNSVIHMCNIVTIIYYSHFLSSFLVNIGLHQQ